MQENTQDELIQGRKWYDYGIIIDPSHETRLLNNKTINVLGYMTNRQ